MDPLLKAAESGLLGAVEMGLILYQSRSSFRCGQRQAGALFDIACPQYDGAEWTSWSLMYKLQD